MKGAVIRFMTEDNTVAIYVPTDHLGILSQTYFVRGGHEDDKLRMGEQGCPADIAGVVAQIEKSQRVKLKLVTEQVFGEKDIVYKVVGPKRTDPE